MTTYTPVATSEVTDGVPVSPVLFNGDGGVRKEWWWQAGPVDSCCCCCSLRAGVGILAANDFFVSGIWAVFYMKAYLKDMLHVTMAGAQQEYNRLCTGTAAALTDRAADCANLKAAIENAQQTEDMVDHEPIPVTILLGVLYMLAGVVGLWAVFGKSAGAAKLYLWSWPAKFVLEAAMRVMQYRHMNEYDVHRSPLGAPLLFAINVFFVLYYLKVSWSFHAVLKKRNKAEASNEGHASARLISGSSVV